jgi:hypothetical protein
MGGVYLQLFLCRTYLPLDGKQAPESDVGNFTG